MTVEEFGRMLVEISRLCNEGPYSLDFAKSTAHEIVYRCEACGAEIHQGTNTSVLSWLHYKPIATVAAEIKDV